MACASQHARRQGGGLFQGSFARRRALTAQAAVLPLVTCDASHTLLAAGHPLARDRIRQQHDRLSRLRPSVAPGQAPGQAAPKELFESDKPELGR